MRLLFTDVRNAICDINYDNAEVVIQELSSTYTESSKLAYCLEINGHQLQVVSEDKEVIEEIAKYIRVTAADYVGKFCYCDMDNVIKIMANGAKKGTNKDYTYNKYVLEKKYQISLDGEALKRQADIFIDKVVQEQRRRNEMPPVIIRGGKHRIRAAELLGKRYGLYRDRIEIEFEGELKINVDYEEDAQ